MFPSELPKQPGATTPDTLDFKLFSTKLFTVSIFPVISEDLGHFILEIPLTAVLDQDSELIRRRGSLATDEFGTKHNTDRREEAAEKNWTEDTEAFPR